MEVSCDMEIYFDVASPAIVDAITLVPPPVRFDVVEVTWERDTNPDVPKPATVDARLRVEMYSDPSVFRVEIRLDRFVFENPVTVEVSWLIDIYFDVPSPAIVDTMEFDPTKAIFDVVDVSCERDTYPAVPKPATVDWRLREEMYLEPIPVPVDSIVRVIVSVIPVVVDTSCALEIYSNDPRFRTVLTRSALLDAVSPFVVEVSWVVNTNPPNGILPNPSTVDWKEREEI